MLSAGYRSSNVCASSSEKEHLTSVTSTTDFTHLYTFSPIPTHPNTSQGCLVRTIFLPGGISRIQNFISGAVARVRMRTVLVTCPFYAPTELGENCVCLKTQQLCKIHMLYLTQKEIHFLKKTWMNKYLLGGDAYSQGTVLEGSQPSDHFHISSEKHRPNPTQGK